MMRISTRTPDLQIIPNDTSMSLCFTLSQAEIQGSATDWPTNAMCGDWAENDSFLWRSLTLVTNPRLVEYYALVGHISKLGAFLVGRRRSEKSSVHYSQPWTINLNFRSEKEIDKGQKRSILLGEIKSTLSISSMFMKVDKVVVVAKIQQR
jgi:hypothetical protein